MQNSTVGIVFQTIKYGESSLITKIYTRHFGLLSFIVKGVRKAKSKRQAVLFQPLRILDLTFRFRENRNLQYINEYSNGYIYRHLPFDVLKASVALFISEVLTHSVREEEPNEALFDFLTGTLCAIDLQKSSLAWTAHLFMLRLSKHLGFLPRNNYSDATPHFNLQAGEFLCESDSGKYFLDRKSSLFLTALLNVEANSYFCEKKADHTSRKKLLSELIDYYRLHIESFTPLKSPAILETVFE